MIEVRQNVYDADIAKAIGETRAYQVELDNASKNALCFKQYEWLQEKLLEYSIIAQFGSVPLINYSIWPWLKSTLLP